MEGHIASPPYSMMGVASRNVQRSNETNQRPHQMLTRCQSTRHLHRFTRLAHDLWNRGTGKLLKELTQSCAVNTFSFAHMIWSSEEML